MYYYTNSVISLHWKNKQMKQKKLIADLVQKDMP